MIAERLMGVNRLARLEPNGRAERDRLEIYVAVIGVGSSVRRMLAATSRAELDRGIARYLAINVDLQLFPDQAAQVRERLDRGALAEAIDLYFSLVGDRWDTEWLEVRRLAVDESGLVSSIDEE